MGNIRIFLNGQDVTPSAEGWDVRVGDMGLATASLTVTGDLAIEVGDLAFVTLRDEFWSWWRRLIKRPGTRVVSGGVYVVTAIRRHFGASEIEMEDALWRSERVIV